MRKLKLTKELLADAAMGRILTTLNKEARDTLVNVSNEEWYKELEDIKKELISRDWRELNAIYLGSVVKDVTDHIAPKNE